jgi:hypothetical protein
LQELARFYHLLGLTKITCKNRFLDLNRISSSPKSSAYVCWPLRPSIPGRWFWIFGPFTSNDFEKRLKLSKLPRAFWLQLCFVVLKFPRFEIWPWNYGRIFSSNQDSLLNQGNFSITVPISIGKKLNLTDENSTRGIFYQPINKQIYRPVNMRLDW